MHLVRTFSIVMFLIVVPVMIIAGTTGKIAGKVLNKETGEPLPSANIQIVGEKFGAATDPDGYFVILQLKPGTYTLKANLLGFSEQVVTEIQVRADYTDRFSVERRFDCYSGSGR
jgi:hypothetical protein